MFKYIYFKFDFYNNNQKIYLGMPTLKIKTITNRELSCTYEQDYTVRMLKENI